MGLIEVIGYNVQCKMKCKSSNRFTAWNWNC